MMQKPTDKTVYFLFTDSEFAVKEFRKNIIIFFTFTIASKKKKPKNQPKQGCKKLYTLYKV